MDMNCAAIFTKVVEAKGFSAAGRLSGMPKTTVSKKVGDLEAELGVRLLNRTTRQISLTEAGARVYAHCVAALRHMEEAEREARALQREPEGMLTVAAPTAIGVPFLVPAITQFMQRYPAVQVALLSVSDPAPLRDGGVDVLIWAGASMPPGHAVKLVAQVEIALYASADYIARHGAPAAPADLPGHGIVGFTQSMSGNRVIWPLRRAGVEVEIVPAVSPRFRSNEAAAVLAAIAAGYGIGGLPTRFVERMAEGRALVPILPGWRLAPIELSALFRDGSASSLKTRLFLDFVADWFRRI